MTSLSEFLYGQRGTSQSIYDFLGLSTQNEPLSSFLFPASKPDSLENFLGAPSIGAPQPEEDDKTFLEQIGGGLKHGLTEFVHTATLGLWEPPPGDKPEGTIEQIGSGLGMLGGFIASPIKIAGGIVNIGAKASRAGVLAMLPQSFKALEAAQKAGRIGGYLAKGAGTMALAEAISDIRDPAGMPERALHGAKIGTIFGAAGLSSIPAHPILGQILRQFGGRAAMALTGEYPEGYFDKENLANLVWSEALNTYFLSHGIDPYRIANGKLRPEEQARVELIESLRKGALSNQILLRGAEPSLPIETFARPKSIPVDSREILIDATSRASEADVARYGEGLQKGIARDIYVEWSTEKGGWVTKNGEYDSLVLAHRERSLQKNERGEKPEWEIKVLALNRPITKEPYLPSVAEVAASAISDGRIVTKETIAAAQGHAGQLFVATVPEVADKKKFGGFKLVSGYRRADVKNISGVDLGPMDILFQAVRAKDPKKIGHDLEVVAVGKDLQKKLVVKDKFAPTLEQYNRMIANQEIIDARQAISGTPVPKIGDEATFQQGAHVLTGTVAGVSPEGLKIVINKAPGKPISQSLPEPYQMSKGQWERLLRQEMSHAAAKGLLKPGSPLPYNVEWLYYGVPEPTAKGSLGVSYEQVIAKARSEGKVVYDPTSPAWVNAVRAKAEPSLEFFVPSPDVLKIKPHTVLDVTDKPAYEMAMDLADLTVAENILKDKEFGKIDLNGKQVPLDKVILAAQYKLDKLRAFPKMELPKEYIDALTIRMKNLGIGIEDPKVIRDLIGGTKTTFGGRKALRVEDLENVETLIQSMEIVPKALRFEVLIANLRAGTELYKTELSQELKERQLITDIPFLYQRLKSFNEAVEWSKKTGGNPLQKMFTLKKPQLWSDLRFSAQVMQRDTPIPLYDFYHIIDPGIRQRKMGVEVAERWLEPFADATIQDMIAVKQHRTALTEGRNSVDANGVPYLKTQFQKDYNAAIEGMVNELAPIIIESRLRLWKQNVRDMEIYGEPTKVRVFKKQNDPEVKEFLERGIEAQMSPEPGVWDAWMKEALDRGLGLIQEGGYLPEQILHVSPRLLDKVTETMELSTMSHSPFSPRAAKELGYESIDDMVVSQFRSENLNLQLHNYVNQVMNVRWIEPALKSLQKFTDAFREPLEKARPQGAFRTGTEPKSYSTMDYLNIWAARAKGFPIQSGEITKILRATQSVFFKSLALQPKLWLRNIYQRYQMAPMKAAMLDPRFKGKGYTYDKLPEEERKYFLSRVDEGGEFRQYYMQQEVYSKFEKNPVMKTFLKVVDKAGSIYAASDGWNRKSVFTKTWYRSKHYIDQYLRGEIDINKMENRIGISKMKPLEQRTFRELITEKKAARAASWVGQWNTENSQWVYRRYAKGLAEMSGEAEGMLNLFTWSKSAVQMFGNSIQNIRDGYTASKILKEIPGGLLKNQGHPFQRSLINNASLIGGTMLAGILGDTLLNTLQLSHKAKFQSYGWDMFTWQFGGVTNSIVTSFTTAVADVITAMDAPPEERATAFENFAKLLDNVGIRQLLPFAKQSLGIAESITGRSYISPLYEMITKATRGAPAQQTTVDRTTLEAIIHATLVTDPNKSAIVRKYTFNKMQELEYHAQLEKNPVYRAWYQANFEYYRYLNDLFMRYEPSEVYHTVVKKRTNKMRRDADPTRYLNDANYQSTRGLYKTTNAYVGW